MSMSKMMVVKGSAWVDWLYHATELIILQIRKKGTGKEKGCYTVEQAYKKTIRL